MGTEITLVSLLVVKIHEFPVKVKEKADKSLGTLEDSPTPSLRGKFSKLSRFSVGYAVPSGGNVSRGRSTCGATVNFVSVGTFHLRIH